MSANTFSIFDLPEDTEMTIDCGAAGLWFGKLSRGSPLRSLLERQQTWQDMHEAAAIAKAMKP